MKQGGEIEKVLQSFAENNLINTQEILKVLRDPSIPKDSVPLDTSHTQKLFDAIKGDLFRDKDEMDSVSLNIGLKLLEYIKNNPDKFSMEDFLSETQENMEKEGWL